MGGKDVPQALSKIRVWSGPSWCLPFAEPWLPAEQGWSMAAACPSRTHGQTTRVPRYGKAPVGNHIISLSARLDLFQWGQVGCHSIFFLPCALWNRAGKPENMT